MRDLSSVAVRLAGSSGRFVLLLVMARTLTPEAVGRYGLVAATVVLGVYVVGADFYTYTTREVAGRPLPERAGVLRAHAQVIAVTYAIGAVAAITATALGLVTAADAVLAAGLVVLDHLSIEGYRLLLALERTNRANVIMLVRTGGWALAWSAFALVSAAPHDLRWVFLAWALGSASALTISVRWLRDDLAAAWRASSVGLHVGLLTASHFIVSSVSYRAMLAGDRYLLEHFGTSSEVGVYTLYLGMSSLVVLIVEAGAVATRFPSLLHALRKPAADVADHVDGFRRVVGRAALGAGALAAAGGTAALHLTGDPTYTSRLGGYLVLVAASVIFASSLTPYYVLYGRGDYRAIAHASLSGLVAMVVTSFALVPTYGLLGTAVGTSTGLMVTAVVRWVRSRRYATESSA